MIPNRWTHRLTAERETDSAGTDEYGQPLPGGSETVIGDEPVRYRPESTEYVRTETGERVQRAATVVTRGHLFGELQEGDTLELAPLGGGTTISDVEVVGVEPQYGRHKRPTSLVIEVDGV